MSMFSAFTSAIQSGLNISEARAIIKEGLATALSTMQNMIGNPGQQTVYNDYVVPQFKETSCKSGKSPCCTEIVGILFSTALLFNKKVYGPGSSVDTIALGCNFSRMLRHELSIIAQAKYSYFVYCIISLEKPLHIKSFKIKLFSFTFFK